MSSKFDHRQFNLVTEADAIDFLDLVVAKAPQLQKILKSNRLKQQSLISRAEFAEGKKDTDASVLDMGDVVEDSIGQRLSGKVTPQVKQVAQGRIEQMRAAAANRGSRKITPAVKEAEIVEPPTQSELDAAGEATLAAVKDSMVTDETDDLLNLPVAGAIGHLPLPASVPQGIDLAAMAAGQTDDEEELAAAAGTTPSKHAADNGVQSKDTEPKAGTPPVDPADTALVGDDDLLPAGDRIASIQNKKG